LINVLPLKKTILGVPRGLGQSGGGFGRSRQLEEKAKLLYGKAISAVP
jgi:hypothetical protein